MRFVDSNIIIRFLTRDDPVKAGACRAMFQRVEQGIEDIAISEAIFTEVCYVLSSNRNPYRLTHDEIRARLVPLLSLRNLRLPGKRRYLRALDLYAAYPDLDIEDAVIIAHMEADGVTEVFSYDTDFDHVQEVRRVGP